MLTKRFLSLFAGTLSLAASAAETNLRPWSAALLGDAAAWPHAAQDVRLAASPQGLRVEVAPGRTHAIAAASRLTLPSRVGLVRVRVAELGGGATWFVRLYGELRRPGDSRTVGVAQDEAAAGERAFGLDPRLRTLDAPLQMQLGVAGSAGAFAVFAEVAFEPAPTGTNRLPRTYFQPGQKDLAAVELMPNLPEPFRLLDWREKARAFDRLAFDLDARGEFLPLAWLDDSRLNCDGPTFGLPSYVGASAQGPGHRNSQEGITCIGAVLGATLAGLDKSRPPHDYAAMCEAWFNARNGLNLVLNRQRDGGGGSFWYELFPHIVFYALADRYPEKARLAEIVRLTADRWRQACLDLAGPDGVPDFDHTSFDFRTRRPVDNGKWREPDAAAGVAWLQYAAWVKFRDTNHLGAAERCVTFLQGRQENPYYEVLLPFGALVAARLNAEHGRSYDVGRLLDWCFGVSDTRGGWGVTVGRWGGYDCDGLAGSIDNRGGYAFALNTFAQAGALVPVARYDPRYARAIGKWMLNLANAARLFYPGELPPGHETSAFWTGDPQHAIAYEGLRREWLGKSPCATGDPVAMKWGPKTDIGLYGSAFAGILGAIVRPTGDPRILQLDCLATDFYRERAWPTFLCYNPYSEERRFAFDAGPAPSDLYDAVAGGFVARGVRGLTPLTLPPDSAAVIVVAPAGGRVTRDGARTVVDGVVANWREAVKPEDAKP